MLKKQMEQEKKMRSFSGEVENDMGQLVFTGAPVAKTQQAVNQIKHSFDFSSKIKVGC